MTNEEFNREMDRLIEVYSSKPYPPTRIKGIYKAIHKVRPDDFKQAVEELINSSRWPPMVTDIVELVGKKYYAYREQKRRELQNNILKADCEKCKKTGVVIAFKETFSYAFRCDCVIAEALDYNYPPWENQLGFTKIDMPDPRD